ARQMKSAAGQLFPNQYIACPIPEQNADLVPAPIAKHEQMPAERVTPEPLRHQRRKPVEALSQVGRLGRHVHAHRRRQRQHACSPDAIASTRSSATASKAAGTRTTRPLGSTISRAAAPAAPSARPSTTRTGTNLGSEADDGADVPSFQRHHFKRL